MKITNCNGNGTRHVHYYLFRTRYITKYIVYIIFSYKTSLDIQYISILANCSKWDTTFPIYSCLNNICFVLLCRIKVFCSMLIFLQICFPFREINENTIFVSMFALCCSSCSEISFNKSDILHSNSATISLVSSTP